MMEKKFKLSLVAATVAFGVGCGSGDSDRPTAEIDTTPSSGYIASSTTEESQRSTSASTTDTNPELASVTQSTEIEAGSSAPVLETEGMGAAASPQQSSGSGGQQTQQSTLEKYIGFRVIDQQGQQIGTADAFWQDSSGKPAFVAISPQRGGEKMHVVPADAAEVNQQQQTIRISHSADKIKSGPSLESEAELDQQKEQTIRAHFSQQPQQSAQRSSGGSQHATQKGEQQKNQQSTRQGNVQVQDEATIRLKEEQLKVGTREVDAGGILLRKVVRTETVNQPVELQREELVIERVEGSGQPIDGNAQFSERQIFIPLQREEAVVEKEAVLKEVVNVGKETEQEQRQVSEQLRAEELQIIERQTRAQQPVGSPGESEIGSGTQEPRPQQQPSTQQQPQR